MPCRHHIYEIILRSVFDEKFGVTSGPNVPLFQRFRTAWPSIDTKNFKPGLYDIQVHEQLNSSTECVLTFCMNTLNKTHYREDYRELLELTVIFLNGTPPRGISFRTPGPIHHARWMSKALYYLKVFIFRQEFNLNKREYQSIIDTCIFIVRLYVKTWFNAPKAYFAPRQDLQFLRDLYEYRKVNEKISEVTLKKFVNHLWYLTSETVALAFFDDGISDDTKNKMAQALRNIENANINEDENYESMKKRLKLKFSEVPNILSKNIEEFISSETQNFFKRFNINFSFIESPPNLWQNNLEYKKGYEIVSKLRVVNDTAERAVKLIEDFNRIGSKNEEQKQYTLQVVAQYRKNFSNSNKNTVME